MSSLWTPSQSDIDNSLLMRFMKAQAGKGFQTYEDVQKWAVSEPAAFWDAFWDFAGILGEKGGEVIRSIDEVPYARFFSDGKISFAENMLKHAAERMSEPAIIARRQDEEDRIISWAELLAQVSLWQQALERAGLKEGDKIGLYLSNVPETVIILLAASNIGAVFASAGMEMGGDDLINRFSQIQPRMLVTSGFCIHGGKEIARQDVVARAEKEIGSIEKTVFLEDSVAFLAGLEPQALSFKRRDFNYPLYILFSSGSTGKPKCFEHSSGGVLLKHLCEYQLNSDVRPGDRMFYHATPSWMMWNWLASGLGSGATILMYDGSPAYPDAYAQWDFTAAHGCTHHGTAAPVILSWESAGVDLNGRYDLSALRAVMSTGAVLPAQSYRYIHRAIKNDVKIASISGGTDLVGCFVGGNPFAATYEGQTNGPMLGCDVQVWNDDGHAVSDGAAGELVCASPFPSMPLRFLNDPGGERYKDEYFAHYPGKKVWRHGDTIQKTSEGQFVIIGRSDATLNQNGVRIGPAVIYDQLDAFKSEIADYAAVDFSRPDNKQAITILFLALPGGGESVPDELAGKIKAAVKNNVTPYAIPTEIIAVPEILKTPNGKKAEVVMKKILAGKDVPNPTLYGEDLVRYYQGIGKDLQRKYGEEAA